MIKAEIRMKRDMDLIRKMLLAIEADEHGFAPKIDIDGYSQEEINYHAVLLGEAGLAVVKNVTHMGANSPEAIVNRLTWAGHEFLDIARENKTWNLGKDAISKVGGASLQILIAVLTGIINKQLGL